MDQREVMYVFDGDRQWYSLILISAYCTACRYHHGWSHPLSAVIRVLSAGFYEVVRFLILYV